MSAAAWAALALVGFGGGTAVGVSLTMVYSVFDFLPVLRSITGDTRFPLRFEAAVFTGCMASAFLYLGDLRIPAPEWALYAAGLFFGAFVGLLAASLSDVTGIIPVLKKKFAGISLAAVAAAMTLGRVCGSMWFFLIHK